MKTQINVNLITETITINKAFYNKSSIYGTDEYKMLKDAIHENPTFSIIITEVQKKSYKKLTFKRMEEYILTQDNSEANLTEFKAVKEIAKVKGSAYPLTKKWFLAKFPEYKLNEVSENETVTIIKKSETTKEDNKQAVIENAVILPKAM